LLGIWYQLGALMLLVVGALSLLPAPEIAVNDKLGHLFVYLVLAAWFGLLAESRIALLWTGLGLLAYGILIELLQSMTSFRFAEWGDVLANLIGIAIGLLVFFTPLRRVLAAIDGLLARIFLR
jgi:VanZ family protein